MKLKELASRPKLERVVVDTPKIVEAYGEPLEFWMWDRQDVSTFLKLLQMKEDQTAVFNLIKEIVLDETGAPVLGDGEALPMAIMIPVLEAAVKHMGNSNPLTTQSLDQISQPG